MVYDEDAYLNIAGIQHFAFCRRQWALIHVEKQWQENVRTVEGKILHEAAHEGFSGEKRGNVIISRGMPIFSRSLGANGVCDIVELHQDKNGVRIYGRDGLYKVIPVEYKRGKPKAEDWDALQLCAQAICLEEMLLCEIPEAYLYYGETRHRQAIILDNDLRCKVRAIFLEMHEMYERRHTPKVKTSKACKACSLNEVCLPKLNRSKSASEYIRRIIKNEDTI